MNTSFILADADEIIPIIAIAGGIVVAIVSIVMGYVSSMHRQDRRAKIQSEIAAYVAEGSISTEEGERLMKAAGSDPKQCG